jgi:hypothetical protein
MSEDRRQRTEGRRQRAEDRGQRSEDRSRKTEDGRQRAEDGGQRSEDRGQKTEGRGQRTEIRGRLSRWPEILRFSVPSALSFRRYQKIEITDNRLLKNKQNLEFFYGYGRINTGS